MIERKIIQVNRSGNHEISHDDFHKQNRDKSSVYLYDIMIGKREDALEELSLFGLDDRILEYILEPSEHIRFEHIGSATYGELGHFSPESDDPLKYIGVIILGNILIFIYDEEEDILKNFTDSIPDFTDENESSLSVPYLLYILIDETLASHAGLILSYREEIEDFAKEFRNHEDIDPDEFLSSKSALSDFNRAIEKLHFTMSFPPVKSIVKQESDYTKYFQELLITTDFLKESLKLAGERLNALHDHYHLMLQDKSNKRLNFLTIIQAIFVPITLITGLYGMNFVFMPELEFKYGYFIALGIMVLIVSGFLRYFYKHGWFD
jgi:magnesium/cobalt transport protein CorA